MKVDTDDLTEAEVARLPGRIRRQLNGDEKARAWAEAKAERDAATELAYQLEDDAERASAIAKIRETWQATKAELAED